MTRAFKLPDTLPLFPLMGAVLLPHLRLPLEVFEPRYVRMIDDAMKTDHRLIGIIQPLEHDKKPEVKAGKAKADLAQMGCAGRIIELREVEDDSYKIALIGLTRFRVVNLKRKTTPYLRAEVDWVDLKAGTAQHLGEDVNCAALMDILTPYLKQNDLSIDKEFLEEADGEYLVNVLSMICPFSPQEKQALIEAVNAQGRADMLYTLMSFALSAGENSQEVLQ